MGRYRRIRTGVRSERELARALGEMGLKDVEVHADAQPLDDWIGRPTDVLANVIVRRKALGSSSDDLGFVRSSDGTFDLVLSDIHLFKFDRKWIAELARRTGTESVDATPVPFASAVAPGANPQASRSVPPLPRAQNLSHRVHIEASELIDKTKRGRGMGKAGCMLYFLPLVPWLLLQQSKATATGVRGLVVLMFAWSIMYFIGLAIVITARVGRVAREFQARFPGREERAAAIAQLRAVAQDKQNEAAGAARQLLAEVEDRGTALLTPRPATSDRATGGKAR